MWSWLKIDDLDQCISKNVVSIWFGAGLCFLRFPIIQDTHGIGNHAKVGHQLQIFCCKRETEEYYFVQNFEIMKKSKMKGDRNDSVLCCTRLGWHRISAIHETLFTTRCLFLVSADAIRGAVHIVCRNTALWLVKKHDPRAEGHFKKREGTERWQNELYIRQSLFVNDSEECFVGDEYKDHPCVEAWKEVKG